MATSDVSINFTVPLAAVFIELVTADGPSAEPPGALHAESIPEGRVE